MTPYRTRALAIRAAGPGRGNDGAKESEGKAPFIRRRKGLPRFFREAGLSGKLRKGGAALKAYLRPFPDPRLMLIMSFGLSSKDLSQWSSSVWTRRVWWPS